jgi:hypothetical protein
LRSSVEDRWREASRAAGKGADLDAMRAVDPDLVERESWLLGSVLRQVVEGLPVGGRALVVGHSPTNEAAVLGLAGQVVPPLGKGKGVLLIEDGGAYRVESDGLTWPMPRFIAGPYTTSKLAIIVMSSCSRLWQWKT